MVKAPTRRAPLGTSLQRGPTLQNCDHQLGIEARTYTDAGTYHRFEVGKTLLLGAHSFVGICRHEQTSANELRSRSESLSVVMMHLDCWGLCFADALPAPVANGRMEPLQDAVCSDVASEPQQLQAILRLQSGFVFRKGAKPNAQFARPSAR